VGAGGWTHARPHTAAREALQTIARSSIFTRERTGKFSSQNYHTQIQTHLKGKASPSKTAGNKDKSYKARLPCATGVDGEDRNASMQAQQAKMEGAHRKCRKLYV